jgi:hypothetical protein
VINISGGLFMTFCALCGPGAAVQPAVASTPPVCVTIAQPLGSYAFEPPGAAAGVAVKLEDQVHTHEESDPTHIPGPEYSVGGSAVTTRSPFIPRQIRRAPAPGVVRVIRNQPFRQPIAPSLAVAAPPAQPLRAVRPPARHFVRRGQVSSPPFPPPAAVEDPQAE